MGSSRISLTSALFAIAIMLAGGNAIAQQTAPDSAPQDAPGDAAAENDYRIDAGSLADALHQFSEQSGIQVFFESELVRGKTAPALSGQLETRDALDRLLSGSGLEHEYVNDNTLVLREVPDAAANAPIVDEDGITQPWAGVEEIIVTGQKREERIQDVPIAISAFSPEDLEAQKIEGGFDLLKGVPNVTFSKTNFSGYNFQIRGIGTQAVSATTDPGVAVSLNNTTLIVNRLFEQEYLDVERVEVLRGPQGTLFGRNATAGVINVISKKPEMGVWDGMFDVEVGNYNTRRLRGMFNMPIGDTLALRGAYASTKRDGFGYNEASEVDGVDVSSDVDNRDLWTGRLTLGWQPNDRLRVNLLWERFEEEDNRVRTSKQLCHRSPSIGDPEFPTLDPGVAGVDPVSFPEIDDPGEQVQRANFSQGCDPGSLYADEAFGTVNGASLPYISGIYSAQFFHGGIAEGQEDRRIGLVLGPNPWFQGHENFATNPFGEPAPGIEPVANAPCPKLAQVPKTYSINLCVSDPYGGGERRQSRDLRTIYSEIEPEYRASADIVELSFDYEVTDELLFSSQSVYASDEYYATQDYNRYATVPIWTDPTNLCNATVVSGKTSVDCSESERGTYLSEIPNSLFSADPDAEGYFSALMGDGVVCDPQLGCSRKLVAQDLSRADSTQYNQEFRLVSSYTGDWNFSLGANYTKFRTVNDYFVFSNAFTHLLHFWPLNNAQDSVRNGCPAGSPESYDPGPDELMCRYIDPNPLEDIDGEGHNYFRSANPYKLDSSALFGELYWNATDTVKVTLGLRMNWDRKVFTPIPSQLLLGDYRELGFVEDGDPPPDFGACQGAPETCPFTGLAEGGRGSPAMPDIVQRWREPTGRLVVDWQPVLGFTDETLVYASFAHGYKGGGANPPGVSPPSGNILAAASAGVISPTFEPEYINAYELGTKNTLFGGAATLNLSAFYYDYTDYQVSKIADRRAVNENFDAEVWGAELEAVFAPSLAWQFNAAIGWLQTEVANGEKSIDLMDRTDGGNRHFANPDGDFPEGFDKWVVIKPWVTAASNCIAPAELLAANLLSPTVGETDPDISQSRFFESAFCSAGFIFGNGTVNNAAHFDENGVFQGTPVGPATGPGISDLTYNARTDAPNAGAGFFKDLGGNELPNSPEFTVALGGQYNFDLTRDWRATARVDYYWQDESYARIYNMPDYDRLKSWSNTNLSFWVNNPVSGITVEAYVKNVFDETPITGSFLNSDDSGLTTNVFTLDPRLIGVSIRKEF